MKEFAIIHCLNVFSLLHSVNIYNKNPYLRIHFNRRCVEEIREFMKKNNTTVPLMLLMKVNCWRGYTIIKVRRKTPIHITTKKSGTKIKTRTLFLLF